MPEIRTIIADTSVLIAFEKLGRLHLLCRVYEEILLPPAVRNEYSSDSQPCFIYAQAPHGLSTLLETEIGMGRGESEAIALAFTSNVPILIDDLKARKTARTLGCQISGTIGVLVKMEHLGLILSAYGETQRLISMGFRVSEKILHKLKS